MKSNTSSILEKNLEKGQVVLILVLFTAIFSGAVVWGMVSPVVRAVAINTDLYETQKSYYLSESGIEDVLYRIRRGKNVSAIETINVNSTTATTTITNTALNKKELVSVGTSNRRIRSVKTNLELSTTAADFNFGVQADVGGFRMENSSSITGNLYANGSIVGTGNSEISGDVVSAGPAGLINGIETSGNAWAHTIENSSIGKDAYYQIKSGTSVGGVSHPGSADQATSSLPFTDETIEGWESEAAEGGTYSGACPYVIDTDTTLGPIKIPCDLEITGGTITLAGSVWVVGNISITNTAIIKLDASYGSNSTGMISDNPADRITSSKIDLRNTVQFFDSGTAGSYVLMASQNESAELGGNEKAITIDNSVNGELLLYAGHGEILLNNSNGLRQLTGYRIRLRNTSNVIYETGLASFLFSSGPAGGWEIKSWREVL